MKQPADYVRQAGFDPIQQEQLVLQCARAHGRITRKDAAMLCRIGSNQASRLLRKLRSENRLQQEGQGRAVIGVVPPRE
jgi:ATP-dependent DNA helicase RecG